MSPDRQPCRICGHLLQEQGRFCQNCGAERKEAIGEPSAEKIAISFPILIIGVPGALIAAYVAGWFGANMVQGALSAAGLAGGRYSAFAPISMVIGVATFLLCMVAINALLKSLKR